MILIAFSANLPSRFGTPSDTICAAYDALEHHGIKVIAKSRIWKTAPVPASDQPWYCNSVAAIETELHPQAIMKLLLFIEKQFGRIRTYRNAARIIDLDLLACGNLIINSHDLVLPHPRLHERAFVLLPLQDVAPVWVHPVLRNDISKLISMLPSGQDAMPQAQDEVQANDQAA